MIFYNETSLFSFDNFNTLNYKEDVLHNTIFSVKQEG